MKRIKVKLIGKGTKNDPFRVNLPTFMNDCKRDSKGKPVWIDEIQGIAADSVDYGRRTCYVLVPDDEAEEEMGKMRLNEKRIREKYRENWSQFKKEDVEAE